MVNVERPKQIKMPFKDCLFKAGNEEKIIGKAIKLARFSNEKRSNLKFTKSKEPTTIVAKSKINRIKERKSLKWKLAKKTLYISH